MTLTSGSLPGWCNPDFYGEADSDEYERLGWSHRANRAALFTCFRSSDRHPFALAPSVVDQLLAATDHCKEQPGCWRKISNPGVAGAEEAIHRATLAANSAWWRHCVVSFEAVSVHRYATRSAFGTHIDCSTSTPWRCLNVTAMLQPAERGGLLLFHCGGEPIDLDLQPGDVCVYDATVLHEVTEILEGERVTLVTHAAKLHPATPEYS